MNNKTMTFIGIIFFIVLFCIYTFTTNNHNNKNQQNTLIVGIAAGYAPFISINEQGNYEGFDIDVIQQVALLLNKKLILKDLGAMTPLLMALEQGSIDLIIWGMSITHERLQKLAMVHYQGTNIQTYPLIFWEKIPTQITSLTDMNDMTICVEPSSAQSAVIEKYPNINILPTDTVDLALLNIQYGKAIAALVDPAIAKKFKNRYKQIQILDIPLAPQDQVQGNGIVIKQNNFTLIEQINKAITILKHNNFITDAENKWGLA